MRKTIWRDTAFLWIFAIGVAISVVYVALVGTVWYQSSITRSLLWTHGGSSGLQAFLTALTVLVVTYYLIETRRLRIAAQDQLALAEQARWPLVFVGLSWDPLYASQEGPVLWAKNVGEGPAIQAHFIGLSTSQPMARATVSLISVISPGGAPVTLIEWSREARRHEIEQDVGKMNVEVCCYEQTGARQLKWVWEGNRDWPGFFELRSFSTTRRSAGPQPGGSWDSRVLGEIQRRASRDA